MAGKNEHIITLKVESEASSGETLKALERWEDDGGLAGPYHEQSLPLRKGEIFEVTGGELVNIDNTLYYQVRIKLLALPGFPADPA